jgi:hypothetical protein
MTGGLRLTQAATEKLSVVSTGPGAGEAANPVAPSNDTASVPSSCRPEKVSDRSPSAGSPFPSNVHAWLGAAVAGPAGVAPPAEPQAPQATTATSALVISAFRSVLVMSRTVATRGIPLALVRYPCGIRSVDRVPGRATYSATWRSPFSGR